ncbi:hypothetical protein [Rhodopirellula sp. MGV]|uniref:hypothetical protein n=1 Tax=Rhodopirellula sp. MGV TaxID=2023130 RepID=UPI000B9671D0|nr:hypothetical protein [Rhodopirellula sp. MGV]OYP35946.1 hypothetical protein CGZ80_09260 [Rhodopirellula sp. MGV]PNY34879.1 hypothetical protein C2E31_21015 [Rhodopirellula baltica]
MTTPLRHLLWLTARRAMFRLHRGFTRLRSPRRIVASAIAVVFLSVYVLNGVLILASRRTADPESLRLWLSGGMVLYLIYHSVRCVWTDRQVDMEYTAAENLWLGGAPISRSLFAGYKVFSVLFSALLKTFFLAIALAPDVQHFWLLAVGVFAALMMLETVRMSWQRFVTGISQRDLVFWRVSLSIVAAAAVVQLFAELVRITPPGSGPGVYMMQSFTAVGHVASSSCVQWLALPWQPAALLATTSELSTQTFSQLIASISLIPAGIVMMVRVDRWANRSRLDRERDALETGQYRQVKEASLATRYARRSALDLFEQRLPSRTHDALALVWRQTLSVRRYFGTIAFSFCLPTLLCLSPLLTGRVSNQWAFVVAGIALCTMLLAPPALRIDFRRDLKRMLLLRGLPLNPINAVLGQMLLPILITMGFQLTTLAIAASVVHPGWSQILGWSGMLSALAVFTFATENALFLAYPHHEHAQGLGMVVRANVMFLGKATLIAAAVGALLLWVSVCRSLFSESYIAPIYITGAIAGTWSLAIAAVVVTSWCWRRFDIAADLPPE